jgi:hypothetical protein
MAVKFTKKKFVTLPLIKLADDTEYFFRFDGAIFKADDNDRPRKESEPKEPPYLAHVLNLETGEMGQIITPAVLKSELEKAYPKDSYVGKAFSLQRHKVEGKRYSTWDIAEIEIEEIELEPVPESVDAKPPKES